MIWEQVEKLEQLATELEKHPDTPSMGGLIRRIVLILARDKIVSFYKCGTSLEKDKETYVPSEARR